MNDHDCSPSSGANQWIRSQLGPFNGLVCANHVCTSLGCSSDVDCATNPTNEGLHTFCAPQVMGTATSQARSAITGGSH
jgi:hypothetical protein